MNIYLNQLKKAGSALTVAIVFSSCVDGTYDPYLVDETRQKQNVFYIPFSSNTPLSKNKDEINLKLQYSGANKHAGLEGQIAYLPSKHIGLTGGFATGGNSKANGTTYHLFEGGAGFIAPSNNQWHFETYGGYGFQKINNYHHTGTSVIKNNYVFFQPAAVVQNKKGTVKFAIVSRLVSNHHKIISAQFNTEREPLAARQIEILKNPNTHLFWEPGLTFQVGWEQFLFHTAYSFSANLSKENYYRENGNFSAGINLRFNHK